MFTSIFNAFRSAGTTSTPSVQVPPVIKDLFQFVSTIINQKDLAEHLFTQYEKIKLLPAVDQAKGYLKVYLLFEDFIITHEPIVITKNYTREELRAEILRNIELKKLPEEFKLIFTSESDKKKASEAKEINGVVETLDGLKSLSNVGKLESEKMAELDTIVSNMPEGVIFLDASMNPLYINTEGKNILQMKDETGILNAFHTFFNIDPHMMLSRAIKTGELFTEEIEKNNNVYEITFRHLIPTKDKQENNYIIFIRDITIFKQLEKAKSEFVSVAAHQLRTPLSGIKWTLGMFLKGDLGELSVDQKTFLMKIYEGNERMILLVNDLLNAEHFSNKGVSYTFAYTQVFDLLDSILMDLSAAAERKSIKIRVEHETLPPIPIDAEKMRLVFQNLLENAVKYTIEGGTITIRGSLPDPNHVLVKITDSGIGIPKEQQANIFKRFYRASNAVSFSAGGSGLGLFLVKTIIDYHEGKVWFESIENKGTTFFLELPLHIQHDIKS